MRIRTAAALGILLMAIVGCSNDSSYYPSSDSGNSEQHSSNSLPTSSYEQRQGSSAVSTDNSKLIGYATASIQPDNEYNIYPEIFIFDRNGLENDGDPIGTIVTGATIHIVAEDGGLYEIVMPYGQTGYITKEDTSGFVSCLGNNKELTNCKI